MNRPAKLSPLAALCAAIGRAQGHTRTAAQSAREHDATLIVETEDGAAELRETDPSLKVVSLAKLARAPFHREKLTARPVLDVPIYGPVIIDPEVIQRLARDLYPLAGDALHTSTRDPKRLGLRDRLKILLGGGVNVSAQAQTVNTIELMDGGTEIHVWISVPWWFPVVATPPMTQKPTPRQ